MIEIDFNDIQSLFCFMLQQFLVFISFKLIQLIRTTLRIFERGSLKRFLTNEKQDMMKKVSELY